MTAELNTSQPTTYDLLDHPDVATEIGFLIMYTATLEAWLVHPLAAMLRVKLDTAAGLLTPIDNIRARIDMLFNLAEAKKGRPLPEAILIHRNDVIAALGFRNAVAHCSFGFSVGGTDIGMVANVTNGARKGSPKNIPLVCADIRAHTTAIKSFIGVINEHCGQALVGLMTDPPRGTASRDKFVLANHRPK